MSHQFSVKAVRGKSQVNKEGCEAKGESEKKGQEIRETMEH
jgi:hypothetical protein